MARGSRRRRAAANRARWRRFGKGLARRLPRSGVSARVLFALFLGFLALAIQNSPLRESTFLATWNRELFDEVVEMHRNTVAGDAPPVLLAIFGGDARKQFYDAHPPGGVTQADEAEYPESTPLQVVAETLASAHRMQAKAVIVDVDVSVMLTQRSAAETAAFSEFLTKWRADPTAPLAIFVRTHLPRNEGDQTPKALATPWDALVNSAPNLAWGTSNGEASWDGVLRYQHYYACIVDPGGRLGPVAAAAVYAAAAARAPTPAAAKREVESGLARQPLCGARHPEHLGGQAAFTPGPGFSVRTRTGDMRFPQQSGLIDYHLDDPSNAGAAPALPKGPWADGARALSVWDTGLLFNALGPDVGKGSIVVLGARQPLSPDLDWTPYWEVDGSVVVANCARGLALAGPIRDLPLVWQIAGLIAMILAVHYFYRLFLVLNGRSRRLSASPFRGLALGATSAPASKLYALALLYISGLWFGSWLLNLGFWQTTPFIGASVYVLMGDALEIIGGGKLQQGD